jgi:hypothetical protein
MGKLFDIISKRKEIFDGIMNTMFTSKHVEEIAAKRMEVCMACPHIDTKGDKCFLPGSQPCCGHCGCKLGFMTRSLSSACSDPDNPRWEAILSPDEEADVNRQIEYDPNNPTQKTNSETNSNVQPDGSYI